MAVKIKIEISNIPAFVNYERLLLASDWMAGPVKEGSYAVTGELDREKAALQLAEIRGLKIGGYQLEVEHWPRLGRKDIRQGRTEYARAKRFQDKLFSDGRARLDEVGRYSLTGENLAMNLAKKAVAEGFRSVTDLCCGCGGNSISFARAGLKVKAIDLDPHRLEMAAYNASLYGVKPDFQQGDVLTVIKKLESDLIFFDPPWLEEEVRISSLEDSELLRRVVGEVNSSKARSLWIKLPVEFDVSGLSNFNFEPYYNTHPQNNRVIKFLLATFKL